MRQPYHHAHACKRETGNGKTKTAAWWICDFVEVITC